MNDNEYIQKLEELAVSLFITYYLEGSVATANYFRLKFLELDSGIDSRFDIDLDLW